MKRVFYYSPVPTDACSFYRGIGPLSQLPILVKQAGDRISWSHIIGADIGLLLRPYHSKHVTVAELIKSQGIPLWVDYDDLLLDVPPENPAFQTYCTEAIKSNIRRILRLADHITVPTAQLAEALRPLTSGKVSIIPNAAYAQCVTPSTHNKTILWRGSQSHQKDVLDYAPQIDAAVRGHPDYEFRFVGMPPWPLTADVSYTPGMDIFEYFQFTREVSAAVQIVPLTDNLFNRCKSNIAWIEATMAGSVTVAPDWPEWRRPGIVNYTPETFVDAIDTAIASPHLALESAKHINKTLLLPQINSLRMNIIS